MNQPPRILVVDDSRTTRELLNAVLCRAGYEVTAAQDGHEALDRARVASPDLVLLDLLLPGIDGAEVLRVLRAARPREDFLPVVCLSVKCDRETRVATLRCGADDYLAKPWDEEELLAKVGSLLRIKAVQDQVRQEKQELERLSVTDALTGLFNRRHFEKRLHEEFRRAQRFGDPLSLLMIDLDHFKAINDEHGHLVGDEVLRAVSAALRHSVREIDIVTRYGGEEFAIILPCTPLPGGVTVAERVWRDIGALQLPVAGGLRLTASLGLAAHPEREVRSEQDLVRVADQALYQAKRDGRNRVGLPPSAEPRPS